MTVQGREAVGLIILNQPAVRGNASLGEESQGQQIGQIVSSFQVAP